MSEVRQGVSPGAPRFGGGGASVLRIGIARPLPWSGGVDPLLGKLEAAGMTGAPYPLTRTLPPADPGPLRRGARALLKGDVDILVLTSPRAVPPLRAALDWVRMVETGGSVALQSDGPRAQRDSQSGQGFERPRSLEIWVVGPETGRAAASIGLAPDRIPDAYSAEGLASVAGALQGKRVLFPRAAAGRDLLVEAMVERGAHVTLVEAYRSEPDPDAARALLAAVQEGALSAVVITASSQARALASALAGTAVAAGTGDGVPGWPAEVPLVAMGPPTASTARSHGLPVAAIAEPHSLDGLVTALRGALVGQPARAETEGPGAPVLPARSKKEPEP
jgi:uroporphyrinogen-III synthase